MTPIPRSLPALGVALALALALACTFAPASALAWEAVQPGTPATMRKGGWAIQFPEGWIQDVAANSVTASRDGALLNSITLAVVPHKSAFAASKRKSSADALPEDLAESYVANLQADKTISDVELVASDPAELGGKPAFRVHVRFRLPELQGGARIEQVTVGAPLPQGLLLATFRAPAIHYFGKWLPAFDAALPSVAYVPAPEKKRR